MIVIEFRRADWMVHASCRGMDPEYFHPPRGTTHRVERSIRALCAECPVSKPCGEMAIEDHTLSGYWGGMSERERRAIRARRNRATRAFASLRSVS